MTNESETKVKNMEQYLFSKQNRNKKKTKSSENNHTTRSCLTVNSKLLYVVNVCIFGVEMISKTDRTAHKAPKFAP